MAQADTVANERVYPSSHHHALARVAPHVLLATLHVQAGAGYTHMLHQGHWVVTATGVQHVCVDGCIGVACAADQHTVLRRARNYDTTCIAVSGLV